MSRKQKGNKSVRKSEKKTGRKTSRRKSERKTSKPEMRASTCLDTSCIDTAVGYMKLLKDKVANFDKQNARIVKQNKTGSKN
jgi:hypothetical protein